MSWLRRFVDAFRPSKVERDIAREMSFHLAERADALRSEGVEANEALRRARVQFGNAALQAERTRDVDVAGWVDAVVRTIRQAMRAVRRTPGFTMTALVVFALGIGANAAVFSAIDTVLFRPLPFPDDERLVHLRQVADASTPIAPTRLDDWRRLNSTFEALTGYYVEDVSDTTGTLPERVGRAVVAPQFLDVWGVAPALGRGFTEAEQRVSGPPAVLISDRYWRNRLGRDPEVLARALRIEGRTFAIAGVMPRTFLFPASNVDLWWPFPIDAPALENRRQIREAQWYVGIGRLKPGVTIDRARADLAAVQARLAHEFPDTDANIRVAMVPYRETVVAGSRASLWLLFGAVSVLLVIACTNIAALLLARAAHREHEVAVRFSLGASRLTVAAQLLVEAGLLAFAGAIAGLAVAVTATVVIRALAPDLPRVEEFGIDPRMLAYTVICSVVVALLCGAFPAVRSVCGSTSLSAAGRTQVAGRHSVQWLLVGVQVALSVTLLSGAALLVRSVEALSRVEPGFEARGVLALRVSGHWGETGERARLVQRIDRMIQQFAALPGAEAAATAWSLPGLPVRYQVPFERAEGRSDSELPLMAEWRTVSPEYFAVLRIPLVMGELCRRSPGANGLSEVMVNRAFAERYFARRSVTGFRLRWEDRTQMGRIAGVVSDAREIGLGRPPEPTVYACDSAPNPFPWFLVRTSGDPRLLAGAVRLKVKELEPLRSVYDMQPLEERIGAAYTQNRLRTVLLVVFAVTALLLTAVGLYGTVSYSVSLRRREIGLRLALGSTRRQVIRGLVARGLRVIAVSVVCGAAASLAVGRALSGMLYGVSPSDPETLAGVLAVVLAIGTLAALIPAARAATTEPMHVLREE
jgi:predicted permease